MGLTAELKKWYIKTIPGMNNKVEDFDLKDRWVEVAQNCRFDSEPGAVDKRDPVSFLNTSDYGGPVTGLYRYYTSNGGAHWVSSCDTKIKYTTDAGTATDLRTGLTTGKRTTFVTYKDLLIGSNGYDNIWVWDGDTTNKVTWELGACKALSSTASGSMDNNVYYYAVTIGSADEYVCGAVSNTISVGTSGAAQLSNIPMGPAGTTARRLYRTEGGGSTLYLIDTISDNTTTEYTDTIADTTATPYPAVTDDMPKGTMLKIHRERLFISGDPNDPNKIYYANPYLPHYIQQTTNLDYMEISPDDGDEIMGIPIQLGVMVCIKKNTIRKLHITSAVSGADPTTWYADDPISWTGAASQWSVTQTPNGVVFLGWDHWYLFDGAGAKPVFDEFDTNDILEASFADTVGYYHKGVFLAAYTDREGAAQAHDRIMRYNFKRETLSYDLWTDTLLFGANCFAARTGDDEPGDLYFGDSKNGYVLKSQDTDSIYSLRTKAQCLQGTASDVFIGGTENSPSIELGADTAADAIPDDVCIFWDDEASDPGTGWVEVTGYEDRIIKISTTALTTAAGSAHTHTLTGSIPPWTGTTINSGDGNPNAVGPHSHEVSYASDGATPLPRHIKYRIFKSSSNTATEFPDGAIVMWDQSSPPAGWLMLQDVGYYISQGTADLALTNSATHGHTFNIPTGTAAGNLAQSDGGGNCPRFGHTHMVTGEIATATLDTWEVDNAQFSFIKKVGESDTWDGVDKYIYCLYASSGTPDATWVNVSTTYDEMCIKTAIAAPSTGEAANAEHTHTAGTFETSTESDTWGNSGYHADTFKAPHTHNVELSASSEDVGTPATVTFRLFKKVLGKMKVYNDAISSSYTSGSWTSPAFQVNAETLKEMFWNETLVGTDNILVHTRTGASQTACEAAAWSAGLTDPNGSTIVSTPASWFQWKAEFTADDSKVSYPRLYFTNGYVVKMSYHTGTTDVEDSVNFIYKIGFRNFDTPGLNKIMKKIISKHEGTEGSFNVYWETENSSGTFTVSLSTYPERWESYFPSDAMGKKVSFTISKNDNYEFRISELEGLYSPTDLII